MKFPAKPITYFSEIRYLLQLTAVICAAGIPIAHAGEGIELAQRSDAVKKTAHHASQCHALGDFYWEIGDANQVRGSGAIGFSYSNNSEMKIASASKWVFGSYVLEKIGKQELTTTQLQALEMQSGFTRLQYPRCVFASTVNDCFRKGHNGEFDSSEVGRFHYNGGHAQKLAIDLGLGEMNSREFGQEIRHYIGNDIDIGFASPQPAGGMKTTPAMYARFLRKIMAGELRMKQFLGYHPVCTLPSACNTASESPVPVAWHYSLHHWIEDDAEGDGAYSSPGAFGFYPWISADKQWYGILAREHHGLFAYKESVYCGEKLRTAWMTGLEQH